MTLLVYIVESLPWAVGGLIVGFLLGVNVRRKLAETERDVTEPRRWWPPNGMVILGLFVALLGVATAVQGYWLGSRTDEIARCQLAYSQGFADAIDARTQAAQEVTNAQDELWRTVQRGFQVPGPDARTQFEKQLNDYLAARQKSKATQEQNPYPPAPRDICPSTGE